MATYTTRNHIIFANDNPVAYQVPDKWVSRIILALKLLEAHEYDSRVSSYVKEMKKMQTNIGLILLAVFLILQAIVLFGLAIPPILLGIVAILAAVFILVGR